MAGVARCGGFIKELGHKQHLKHLADCTLERLDHYRFRSEIFPKRPLKTGKLHLEDDPEILQCEHGRRFLLCLLFLQY